MTFAAPQPAVERPKRLQFSNGTIYSYDGGLFRVHDTSDDRLEPAVFVSEVVQTAQDQDNCRRLMDGELELIAASAVEGEAREVAARAARRSMTHVDPNLPPAGVAVVDEQKPLGSQWMFYPRMAGYEDVWPPGPARIIEHVTPGPLPPGTPERDYIVERDGGVRLFANNASLIPLSAVPTQIAISIEERSKLNAFVPYNPIAVANDRKTVGSEWLFDPTKAGDPTGKPVLCRVLELVDENYRIVTSGGAHKLATDESLTSLAAL